MGSSNLYFFPVLISLILHVILMTAVFLGWESADNKHKQVKIPRHVQATLVKLDSKSTKKKAIAKKKAAQKKKKLALDKKRRDAEKKKKAAAERKRKAAEKKSTLAKKKALAKKRLEEKKLEQERQQEQQLKQMQELAFSEALAEEDALFAEEESLQIASSYVDIIVDKIEAVWSRPPSARKGMQAELMIQLVPTGKVVSVSIVKSSGNAAFDRSAELAVRKVDRFSELQKMPPDVFERHFRQLKLVFNPQDLRL